MQTNSNEKKYPDAVGALWVKENENGKFFSMTININGTDHTFFGFQNRFKKEGERSPDYRIYLPKDKQKTSGAGL